MPWLEHSLEHRLDALDGRLHNVHGVCGVLIEPQLNKEAGRVEGDFVQRALNRLAVPELDRDLTIQRGRRSWDRLALVMRVDEEHRPDGFEIDFDRERRAGLRHTPSLALADVPAAARCRRVVPAASIAVSATPWRLNSSAVDHPVHDGFQPMECRG